MTVSGAITVSLYFHAASDSGNDFKLSWTTDATLAGTGYFDNDGDFVKDDGMLAIAPIDCAAVTIP